MPIRTPEDIENAFEWKRKMLSGIKKLDKEIERGKRALEHDKLESDINAAVYKIFMNTGDDAHAEIDILHWRYRIMLTKYRFYGPTEEYVDIRTWEMQDDKPIRLISCGNIKADLGFKLLTHIISSIIFKRTAMLRKELKKLESQDTAKHEPKEVDGDGNSETVG